MPPDRPEFQEPSLPRSRTTLKGLWLGPPRRGRREQIVVAVFGLLLVLRLAGPAFADTVELAPETTLGYSGLLFIGFAELLDPKLHWFVVGLRVAGATIALCGVVLFLL